MKTYTVEVEIIKKAYLDFTIQAENEEDAKKKLETVNYIYNSDTNAYDTEIKYLSFKQTAD